ncbi:MAG: PD-(D/E)XK nuclease family protein [Endomicrobium sp.]|jgi:hypothetical protein|nr:PD-(D/E)XK nuclease family protein [Endomicrobium sp.]
MPIDIINVDIQKNILVSITEHIKTPYEKTAIISGGKRPFLFINKLLAKKNQKAFHPPTFFTNESFVRYSVYNETHAKFISDFEGILILLKILQNNEFNILNFNTSFLTTIDWIHEILLFIEQLDFENIGNSRLKFLEANAAIGYDIPKNINHILENILYVRQKFHKALNDELKLTMGYAFLKGATEIQFNSIVSKIDELILLSPFYLYKTEIAIYRQISSKIQLTIFVHGDPNQYNVLKELYTSFGQKLPHQKNTRCENDDQSKFHIYAATDNQSQSALIKNIINKYSMKELDSTTVVILDNAITQCVVSEILTVTNRYNLTTGYPIEQTSLFLIINLIIEAQLTRQNKYYYSQAIIDILNNQIMRNIKFKSILDNIQISEIIAYCTEKFLTSNSNNLLYFKKYILLKDIVMNPKLINVIYNRIITNNNTLTIKIKDILNIMKKIFKIFFDAWESIDNFNTLTDLLLQFFRTIYPLINFQNFSLEFAASKALYAIAKELQNINFLKRQFTNKEILTIFKAFLKGIKISLPGSPLKGIQILGLLETRNLIFDNVFVIGMNDSALPYMKKDYPLIPIEIMNSLGLKRIEQQKEIQKYHFKRLLKNSKNIYLIYQDNEVHSRSRFIESIIWEQQQKDKNLHSTYVKKFILSKEFLSRCQQKRKYLKTKTILHYLKNMTYTFSKLNVYLQCRLKFYFMYVLLLEKKVNFHNEVTLTDIGNFIHNFLNKTFHQGLTKKDIVKQQFRKKFFQTLDIDFNNCDYLQFRSDALLIKKLIYSKMEHFLHYDTNRLYNLIYASEQSYQTKISTVTGATYNFKCKIDRIDQIDQTNYIILDYKTGLTDNSIIKTKHLKNLDNKFINLYNIKSLRNSLQLPVYRYIFETSTGLPVLHCGIYNIKQTNICFLPKGEDIYIKCVDIIKFLLDEINNTEYFEFDNQDFSNIDCDKCEFFYICR